MKKRTESNLVTAVLRYLEVLQNLKVIGFYDRLNSGKILARRGDRVFMVRLCQTGTSDGFIALNDGSMIWWECKIGKGKQTLEDLRNFLKSVGVKVL